MRDVLILIGIVILVAACASSSERGAYTVSGTSGDTPEADESLRTFSCPKSLGDCFAMAKEHCGDAGYARVRQAGLTASEMASSGMSAYGSRQLTTDEIRSRAQANNTHQTSMTVRCKEPREEADSE